MGQRRLWEEEQRRHPQDIRELDIKNERIVKNSHKRKHTLIEIG